MSIAWVGSFMVAFAGLLVIQAIRWARRASKAINELTERVKHLEDLG